MHKVRHVVVQVRESNPVFRPNWLSDDYFVDVVKLVPIFVSGIRVLDQRLEFRSTRNGHVQGFGREEGLCVKQVKEVLIDQICQQLISKTVQSGRLR